MVTRMQNEMLILDTTSWTKPLQLSHLKGPSSSVSSSEGSGDLGQSQVIGDFQALVGGELHSQSYCSATASLTPALCLARVLAESAPDPGHACAVCLASSQAAEIAEAALEVFIQEGIEDGVEAAVSVAQCHAEEVGAHDGRGLWHFRRQDLHQDEDVNGRPAHDEHGYHHQNQTRDTPQVAVLLTRA